MSKLTRGCKVPWQVAPRERVALFDADGPLYSAARAGVTICDGEQLQMLDDEEIYQDALKRLAVWETWTGDTEEVFVCLTSRRNFRKDILPSYKGNRHGDDRPITLDALRGMFIEREPYTIKLVDGLEADDVCGIAATSFQELGYETVIVSPDKDLLQIPGMILTPKPNGKGRQGEVVFSEVTEPRAFRWHMMQTLMGDSTDNYKGCPGMGPGRASDLLDGLEVSCGFDPARVWEAVEYCFTSHGQTPEYALIQARVARILRFGDWDAQKKEVMLWQPPI